MFKRPNKRGLFKYEICPTCGAFFQDCNCREKNALDAASQFDIITSAGGLLGFPPGCLFLLALAAMAGIIAYGSSL